MTGAAAGAVRLRDVTLRFGGVSALDGVGFDVRPGTIHGLVGPNGAGKSSCLNVISGVYRPSSGTAWYGEHDLTRLPPHRIAALGVGRTFQNLAQSGRQTVLENLMMARHHLTRSGFVSAGLGLPWARREEREHRARVCEIAESLGLADRVDTPTGVLPYGDRKRVEIARAVALEPSLLLLDEPVAGMDARESAVIAETVRRLRDGLGLTVVLIEHDVPLVMQLAERITVLDFGKVIADGTPDEVRTHPDVVRAYLGTAAEGAR